VDARGEPDLRSPLQSSLGFMVRRPEAADSAAAQRAMRAASERAERLRSAIELHAAPAAELAALGAELEAVQRALGAARRARQPREFADLLAVERPIAFVPVIESPGHYKASGGAAAGATPATEFERLVVERKDSPGPDLPPA
jgi:hypothetical protein